MLLSTNSLKCRILEIDWANGELYDVTQSGALEKQVGLERRPFSGTTAQVAEDIRTYARLGVSELIFDFRSETLTESLERMEHFATVIRPAAGE